MAGENGLTIVEKPEIVDLGTPQEGEQTQTESEEKEGEEKSTDGQENEGHDYKPRINKAQKRINELTWQRREAERGKEQLARKLEEKDAEIERLKTQSVSQESGKPKPEDFDDQNDYLEALTDWKVDQKIAQIKPSSNGAGNKQPDIPVEVAAQIQVFEKAGRSKYDDFDAIALNPNVINLYSPTMEEEILTSDFGADLAYYFGTHADEADRISRLSPNKATREIVQLEAKFKKQTTNAPPPINPISSGVSISTKDPSKMTQREYEVWRSKGGGG